MVWVHTEVPKHIIQTYNNYLPFERTKQRTKPFMVYWSLAANYFFLRFISYTVCLPWRQLSSPLLWGGTDKLSRLLEDQLPPRSVHFLLTFFFLVFFYSLFLSYSFSPSSASTSSSDFFTLSPSFSFSFSFSVGERKEKQQVNVFFSLLYNLHLPSYASMPFLNHRSALYFPWAAQLQVSSQRKKTKDLRALLL